VTVGPIDPRHRLLPRPLHRELVIVNPLRGIAFPALPPMPPPAAAALHTVSQAIGGVSRKIPLTMRIPTPGQLKHSPVIRVSITIR
jgi:hypothetical protein